MMEYWFYPVQTLGALDLLFFVAVGHLARAAVNLVIPNTKWPPATLNFAIVVPLYHCHVATFNFAGIVSLCHFSSTLYLQLVSDC